MNAPRIRPAGRLRERWQLRIELLDVNPLIWRRLLLPADIALPKLHRVFQIALGWTNSHLHEFVIGGPPSYAQFLAAVTDPRHEQHRNCLEWCGDAFDPARFDRAAVNRSLAKLRA